MSSHRNRRKGQALVLEEMFMFALGVCIVTGVVYMFNNIDAGIQGFVNKDQAEELNSLIKANIVSLKSSGCSKCYVVFEVSPKIGGQNYNVYGEGTKKKVLVYDNTDVWNEKNVSLPVYGTVSGSERIMLEYDGDVIVMRGVDYY